MEIPTHMQHFWNEFLASESCPPNASKLFLESFQIGTSATAADHGLNEILTGVKTATSSSLWQYELSGEPIPEVGSLSVVEDGSRKPRCVVRTVWVEITPIGEIDEEFARDYGETDGTLKAWHAAFDDYYAGVCTRLGREFDAEFPLLCERFEVLFIGSD